MFPAAPAVVSGVLKERLTAIWNACCSSLPEALLTVISTWASPPNGRLLTLQRTVPSSDTVTPSGPDSNWHFTPPDFEIVAI